MKNSTGKARGAKSVSSIVSTRAATFSFGGLAAPRPEMSPLMSLMKTGTPAIDSCSAMTCRVFVLPVPVAPATSPWRLSIASGKRITASGSVRPSCMAAPTLTSPPSNP